MSCDERVLREMGIEETKEGYSMSLVALAREKRFVVGSPLAFGESGIKKRVKNVLHFKKYSKLVSTAAIILVAVLSMGLMMNQAEAATPEGVQVEPQSPYRLATSLAEVRAILHEGNIPVTDVDVPEIRSGQARGIIITQQDIHEALSMLNEAYRMNGRAITSLITSSPIDSILETAVNGKFCCSDVNDGAGPISFCFLSCEF